MGKDLTDDERVAFQAEVDRLREEHRDLDAALQALLDLGRVDQLQGSALQEAETRLARPTGLSRGPDDARYHRLRTGEDVEYAHDNEVRVGSNVFSVAWACGPAMPFDIQAYEGPGSSSMRKKTDLPSKICASCGRPFTWRKKWERVWDEVKYCSDRCRSEKRHQGSGTGSPSGEAAKAKT